VRHTSDQRSVRYIWPPGNSNAEKGPEVNADHLAPAAEWRDWSAFTSGPFSALEFPGGHMYLTDRWSEVWRTVEALV
ncbi:hypothetical protein ABT366_37825, partial [Streptomyces lydicus]